MLSSVNYGRRVLIFLFATSNFILQVQHGGDIIVSAATILVQLAAIFFGGAPGTLFWLLFSRIPSELSNVRTWNSAMHWQIVATIACQLIFVKYLSPSFLGLSAAFLLFCYVGAKQGCYRLGCCGWAPRSESYQILRRRIELQKLEALIAVVLGTITSLASIYSTEQPQYTVYLVALAAHLTTREIFNRARAHGGEQIL